MLIVISPAKTLALAPPPPQIGHTEPQFMDEAAELIALLRQKTPAELGAMMDISPALAELNVARHAAWRAPFDRTNAKQAVLAFDGDVYAGLDASSLDDGALAYLQDHVRILSGLYGVLRPLDLMQAYRLEMGSTLANRHGRSLYAFWGARITDALNAALAARGAGVVVNLASEEYFKAVKPALLAAPVVTPVFEDWKNGRYKIISFFAKRARGRMARFAAQARLRAPGQLKRFDLDGYAFAEQASDEVRWVFRRREAD